MLGSARDDWPAAGVTARRVGLVTSESMRVLSPDDQQLAEALRAADVSAEAVVWSQRSARWDGYDALIVRSCWDYHLRVAEFLEWLARIEAMGTPMWNAPALIRWNHHKRYLLELAAAGHAIVPTVLVPRGATMALTDILADHGWARGVVKPAVSASAYETWPTSLTDALSHEARWRALLASRDMIVQPFVDRVIASGELSLVFLAGEFSHAVRKRAAARDFRVQREFGGTAVVEAPEVATLEHAAAVLRCGAPDALYARVDGIVETGRFVLTELELIEPDLFLSAASGALHRFATVIMRALATRSGEPGRP